MDITLENLLNNRSNFNAQQSIKNIINKTLEDNDLSPSDIDCIYLTGGMANYDQISKTINSVISKPVIVADAPLFCTATGVALSLVIQTPEGTSEIAKNVKSQLKNKSSHSNQKANTEEISAKNTETISKTFIDTTKSVPINADTLNINISETKRMGMSYFIDVEDNMPVEIISKDETYPCLLKKSDIQLKTSSQSRMNLILYEGQNVFDCNMKILRQKIVEFNEMVNVGTTIDISYKIDANKLITIYASINGEAPFEFTTEEAN